MGNIAEPWKVDEMRYFVAIWYFHESVQTHFKSIETSKSGPIGEALRYFT